MQKIKAIMLIAGMALATSSQQILADFQAICPPANDPNLFYYEQRKTHLNETKIFAYAIITNMSNKQQTFTSDTQYYKYASLNSNATFNLQSAQFESPNILHCIYYVCKNPTGPRASPLKNTNCNGFNSLEHDLHLTFTLSGTWITCGNSHQWNNNGCSQDAQTCTLCQSN